MTAPAGEPAASNVPSRNSGLCMVLLCAGLFWSSLASAAHTSEICDARSATVSVGGAVTVDVTDCATTIDFAGNREADGPALPQHGTAMLRVTGGAWLVDYAHNGNAATSDVFEFTDGTVQGRTVQVTITINQPPSPLTLTPDTLPPGVIGQAYSGAFTTTGGVAPYRYAVTDGALPPGLSLALDGSVSGTPQQVGNYQATVRVEDSTAGTPLALSRVITLQVREPAPVAADDAVTIQVGRTLTIVVTANDTSSVPITSIAITRAPAAGSALVAGLFVSYTAPDSAVTDTFEYVAIGPGGTSQPATVTVVVTPVPLPTAPRHVLVTLESRPVQVELTARATGGPFTNANVVSLSPAGAGSTAIAPAAEGNGFVLTFTPVTGFVGLAQVRYTLTSAAGTSSEGNVLITVQARPDPSLDPEVRSLVDAQVESTRRFADSQVGNFQQRLERLRIGGKGGFANGLGFAIDRACIEPLVGHRANLCAPGDGLRGGTGLSNGATADATNEGAQGGAVGTWIGGMIRSGTHDGRNGNVDIDFETDGISAGIDYRIRDDLVVGAGFGYGKDENAVGVQGIRYGYATDDTRGSRVDGDARTVALYASYHPGAWFVDVLLGYQTLDYDLLRKEAYSVDLINGQREGSQLIASLSVGADFLRENAMITPYARLDVARGRLDAFTETGSPVYALAFEAMDVDNTSANLGLRLRTMHELAWGRVLPQFRVEYQHDIGGRSEAVVRYADIVGGQPYRLVSAGFNDRRLAVGLGAQLELDGGWGGGLELHTRVGDSSESDHGLRLSVQKQF